jgi:pantoate--beta-alanine ligase
MQFPEFNLEYFEIADFDTLESIKTYNPNKKVAFCIAIFLDGVRLIDNLTTTAPNS